MKTAYKRVGIIVKPHREVTAYLKQTVKVLKELQVEIILEDIAADLIGMKSRVSRKNIAQQADVIIVIGGDGTFLSIAEPIIANNIPVAGFNLGTLGFLTELKKDTLEKSLVDIVLNKLKISERKILQISFRKKQYIALNDVVVSKGNIARTIKLQLGINDLQIAKISSDGLIISTPTGSTAYSLSAGGPILSPDVNAMIVTPICPHSLTFRPLVISDRSRITVNLLSGSSGVFLTIDGQKVIPMDIEDQVKVSIFGEKLKMIVSKEMNYFKLLNEKLNWGL